MTESERYPGYDVLQKRHSPSWNEPTRRVINARMSIAREPRFFTSEEWLTLSAICDRVMPQPSNRPPVPLAAYIDDALLSDRKPGYRNSALPPQGEAWRLGLAAFEAEAQDIYRKGFTVLHGADQDALLRRAEAGTLASPAWRSMSSKLFFSQHVMPEIIAAYYAHPSSWNEIGFGGPASPRGYVRMGSAARDPWEPIEATPGQEAEVREKNRNVR